MYARHFQFNAFRNAFAPRKPRHPLLRLGIGLLGLAVLAVLVFVSVFVGAAMIAGSLLYRLLQIPGAAALFIFIRRQSKKQYRANAQLPGLLRH